MPEARSVRAIAAIGECMVELAASRRNAHHYERRYGGDTLNTAVYLARLLKGSGVRVHYVTRLGDDPLSRWMIEGWQSEGIDCRLVETVKGRLPGLYMIDTDDKGERSFTYWRSEAPARELFSRDGDPLLDRLLGVDALYTSGITLAVLSDKGRAALIDLMRRRRDQGGLVAFDTNYRARLWASPETARPWFEKAIRASTIALPSAEDLASVFGAAAGGDWLTALEGMGASEIVLKASGDTVRTSIEGRREGMTFERSANPVDTTGAGDSFNAGYIAARLKGSDVRSSVIAAHELASRVIQFPGAIIPREAMGGAASSPP